MKEIGVKVKQGNDGGNKIMDLGGNPKGNARMTWIILHHPSPSRRPDRPPSRAPLSQGDVGGAFRPVEVPISVHYTGYACLRTTNQDLLLNPNF